MCTKLVTFLLDVSVRNSGPFGSLGPVATVGESSSSSFPGGVREPSPFPGCPPLCHQSSDQGVVGVAPQSSTGALCATPPELLQLIQVIIIIIIM